jgi:hypothetical protein
MCQAINQAIMDTLQAGVVRSTSLMVPCPWASHAMHFLRQHPEFPFGVHLTATCDGDKYTWGPVACREKVPALVDEAGHFLSMERLPTRLDPSGVEQLEVEFKAQIEVVLKAGLQPTHLDWHALRIFHRPDILDLLLRLAREYGLALRVASEHFIQKVRNQGLPCNDYDFLDSSCLDPADKASHFARLLHALPAGLSEWAVHPGLDTPELLAMEPGDNRTRQADYDFCTSQLAKDIVQQEGVILLDYRTLQAAWSKAFGQGN